MAACRRSTGLHTHAQTHYGMIATNKTPAVFLFPPCLRCRHDFSATAPLAGSRRGHVPAGQSDMQPAWWEHVAQSLSAVYFKSLSAATRLGCLGRFGMRQRLDVCPAHLIGFPSSASTHRRRRDAAPSSPMGPWYQSPSKVPSRPLACFSSVRSSLAVVSGVAAVPRASWRIYETISDFRLPITPSVGTTTRAACTLPGTGLSRQLCFFRSCIAPWSSCAKIDAASSLMLAPCRSHATCVSDSTSQRAPPG
jgi:hypothetical protein